MVLAAGTRASRRRCPGKRGPTCEVIACRAWPSSVRGLSARRLKLGALEQGLFQDYGKSSECVRADLSVHFRVGFVNQAI